VISRGDERSLSLRDMLKVLLFGLTASSFGNTLTVKPKDVARLNILGHDKGYPPKPKRRIAQPTRPVSPSWLTKL